MPSQGFPVNYNGSYTLRVSIADANNGLIDSVVMLPVGSLKLLAAPVAATGGPYAVVSRSSSSSSSNYSKRISDRDTHSSSCVGHFSSDDESGNNSNRSAANKDSMCSSSSSSSPLKPALTAGLEACDRLDVDMNAVNGVLSMAAAGGAGAKA